MIVPAHEKKPLHQPPPNVHRPPPEPLRVPAAKRVPTLIAVYGASVVVLLGLCYALIIIAGNSPADVADALYRGSVADLPAVSRTLQEAAPLLIVALGTAVAFRAGLVNIGQEGQVILGAVLGAIVGLEVGGPPKLVLALTLLASCVGGALWAGIAALMRYWAGISEVVVTLLLTFIAFQLVSLMVTESWLLRESTGSQLNLAPQSDPLPQGVALPFLGQPTGLMIGVGFLMAVGLAAIVALALARSRWGFRLRLLGLNPIAARCFGVRAGAVGGAALVLSGAFAGLAGGVVLTTSALRLQPYVSHNYGWEGLLVALLARQRPTIAVVFALVFGGLRASSTFVAATGLAPSLVNVIEASIIFAALVPAAYLALRKRNATGKAIAS